MRRDGEVDKIWPSQTAFLDTNPLLRLGESLIDTAAIYMDFCVRVLFLTTSALHNSIVIALHPFEFAAVASMYGLFNHCIQLVPMRVEIVPIQLRKIELSDLDREAIGESMIQRFETCYDTLWKTLKRYLSEETGLADTPNSPKPILKLAGQNDLLAAPVEQWLTVRRCARQHRA